MLPHTTPNHIMRMVNGKGQVLANVAPGAQDFGWSRRNGFIQPLVDAELLKGLSRFDHVDVQFSHTLLGYVDDADGVTATVELADGTQKTIRARYLVGCDGGRSITRKSMGVSFEGQSSPTRFLVIDVRNDPLGTPNAYLGADPVRPFVSIGLPHGVRRFEYMIFDHETDEQVADPLFVHQLLARHVPDPAGLDFIRQRVYTLHARIAGAFRKGHVLIAGDAAHLMPVWQGQGYNSGVRDATNLAWKLTAILRGIADDALLDTYDTERRDHAKAMIDVSVAMGRILSPTNKAVAGTRDKIAAALNLVPAAKKWIAEGRYKPKPRFHVGALVEAVGPAAEGQPVGSMFPQPRVDTRTEQNVLLDDVLGPWFSVLVWGNDPRHVFDAALPGHPDPVGREAGQHPAVHPAALGRRTHRRPTGSRRGRHRDRRFHRPAQVLVRHPPGRVRHRPPRPVRRRRRARPARLHRCLIPGHRHPPQLTSTHSWRSP